MELLIVAAVVALLWGTWFLRARTVHEVFPGNIGLEYRGGRFVGELSPGRHVRFDPRKLVAVWQIPTAPSVLGFGAVNVITKDQFSLRVRLSAICAVTDPVAYLGSHARSEFDRASSFLSAPLIATLVESRLLTVVGEMTLDELLADTSAIVAAVGEGLDGAVPGLTINRLVVSEVTLPPEVRKMFTEVERARRDGLALLERARSEQASLRVLANAARLLANNPALSHLRNLQAMETAKGAKTFILGNPGADLQLSKGSAAD